MFHSPRRPSILKTMIAWNVQKQKKAKQKTRASDRDRKVSRYERADTNTRKNTITWLPRIGLYGLARARTVYAYAFFKEINTHARVWFLDRVKRRTSRQNKIRV